MDIGEKSYLSGKARRWFWPGAAFFAIMLIWSMMSSSLYSGLLDRVNLTDSTAFVIAGIQTALHTAVWVVLMAVYGFANKVKAFKVMFLVVGGAYLLGAFGHFLSNYYVSYILQFQGRLTPAMQIVSGVLSLVVQAAWITFCVILLRHPRSGKVLKVSAVLLLISRLLGIAYSFGAGPLYQWLSVRYETVVVTPLMWFLGVGMILVTLAPIGFLLGAMSFSRMKPDQEPEPEAAFPQI